MARIASGTDKRQLGCQLRGFSLFSRAARDIRTPLFIGAAHPRAARYQTECTDRDWDYARTARPAALQLSSLTFRVDAQKRRNDESDNKSNGEHRRQ